MVHGLPPHRVGIHVEAEGALVAPVEGLQIDDRAVGFTRARGLDRIARESLCANRGNVRIESIGGQHDRIAHPLNTRKVALDLQPIDERAPLGTQYLTFQCRKYCDTAAQDLLVILHARKDPVSGVDDLEFEALLGALRDIGFGHVPAQRGDGQ